MKNTIFLFLCLISILGLSSCNGDNFIEQTPTVIDQQMTSGHISFTYKDVLYSSNYETDGQHYRYDNPEFITILDKIQKLPQLAFLCKSDGSYEYFDSYQELCEKEKIGQEIKTRSTGKGFGITSATLKIYTRSKYRGDSKAFYINLNRPGFYIADLGVYGLDEQITSMRIDGLSSPDIGVGYSSCSATFFEHKNFQGRSGTFTIFDPNINLGVKDFAKYYFGHSPAPYILDDLASSIMFYLGAGQ